MTEVQLFRASGTRLRVYAAVARAAKRRTARAVRVTGRRVAAAYLRDRDDVAERLGDRPRPIPH